MQDVFDPILSEEELAKWLDTSRPTLQRQRSDGSGPPFVQLSDRRIGYRRSAIEKWLDARTINRVGALGTTNSNATTAGVSTDDASLTSRKLPTSRATKGSAEL
jgi:predicted DNA-binding transcriptional regulator AlpA